ncbi:putative hydroxymethylpyrimidine transporter CytX [Lachnoanaerobaculum sp. JCM 36186]|jgi:probable hydroxymethylpyrimidine transporter cytX|uniref:putative hydroxymethylpyrimidine transporter CytX n=1 Tax=Lachnoanaerobaculum sanguinis TaxID=3065809 RepID=UPI002755C338|nr:putative hydroxymethylpyrimidine transporter CytX [Lachnoanaerobaculum sp. JCM 36186]GMO01840.1 putative hydroxymethylpyrimidine transporter CytX [Lachnoanaerobaculum sp. JCM 36186]
MNKKTSVFENGLIWFGAAVSIAEILTGTYFASLGFLKGLLAIVLGHIVGCILLFLAGMIGAKTQKSAMDTVKISFGTKGGIFFAILNILQLFGWTGIMIYDGASATQGILPIGHFIWCIVIGGLVLVWILIGVKNLGKLNVIAMSALFLMTIILSFIIFKGGTAFDKGDNSMSFGAAMELSIAMPLSWLPLISDYTKEAKEPVKATAASSIVYGFVSIWMYIIGMSAALFTMESDIAKILLKAGLGIMGLFIVVLSTVTTTFLDVYSAGVSTESIFSKIKSKWVAVAVTVIGTLGAIVLPMDDITGFLYLIGSVFAPMIAIQIADFFILKISNDKKLFSIKNIIFWVTGFIIYRILMKFDIPIGSTIPSMLITIFISVAVSNVFKIDK